jgi:hypothetical protein
LVTLLNILLIRIAFSATNDVTADSFHLVVRTHSLSKGDTLRVTFDLGNAFLVISQPNACHVNVAQLCSWGSSSSCHWVQTSRSHGVVLLGRVRGIAEIVATSPGQFFVSIGYLSDDCCSYLVAYSHVFTVGWLVFARETDCWVQTATGGRFILSSAPLNSSVMVRGYAGSSQPDYQWGSSTERPSSSGLKGIMFINPSESNYTFVPYATGGYVVDSAGGNEKWDYGVFHNESQRSSPLIIAVTGTTAVRVGFSSGRYQILAEEETGLSGGATAGIVVAILAVSGVGIFVAWWCCRKAHGDGPLREVIVDEATPALESRNSLGPPMPDTSDIDAKLYRPEAVPPYPGLTHIRHIQPDMAHPQPSTHIPSKPRRVAVLSQCLIGTLDTRHD